MTSPPYIRSDVRAFLAYLAAAPGPKIHELDPVAARQLTTAMRAVADLPVGELAVIRDVAVAGPAGPIKARLFDVRATRAPGPLVVFFHGGGWVLGDLDLYAGFTAEMSRQLDLPVISVDYRLAPEARWPAAADDCEAAARWAATGPAELGRGVSSLVLAGDSAGGQLAIVTAMALRDDPAAVPVIVQAPIYPATDLRAAYPSFDAFADGFLLTRDSLAWFDRHVQPDPAHVRASPLAGNLMGLPPAAILTASLDPIRDQGRAYAAALVQAGVPVVFREAVGTIHGFITLRRVIPSAIGDIAGYLSVLKPMIVEAEGERAMRQAEGAR